MKNTSSKSPQTSPDSIEQFTQLRSALLEERKEILERLTVIDVALGIPSQPQGAKRGPKPRLAMSETQTQPETPLSSPIGVVLTRAESETIPTGVEAA